MREKSRAEGDSCKCTGLYMLSSVVRAWDFSSRRDKIIASYASVNSSSAHPIFPGDLQDGMRVCMVFRSGIETGRNNKIVT